MAKLGATTALAGESAKSAAAASSSASPRPGRAHHGVDALVGVDGEVGAHGVGHAEVDHHLGARLAQRDDVTDHGQPLDDLPVVTRVHCGDELEVGSGGHGAADLTAHPAAGPDDTDLAHGAEPYRPASDGNVVGEGIFVEGPDGTERAGRLDQLLRPGQHLARDRPPRCGPAPRRSCAPRRATAWPPRCGPCGRRSPRRTAASRPAGSPWPRRARGR